MVAAELTGRVCCGLELDPKYVDVIGERWQKMTGKEARLEGQFVSFRDVRSGRGREGADGIETMRVAIVCCSTLGYQHLPDRIVVFQRQSRGLVARRHMLERYVVRRI